MFCDQAKEYLSQKGMTFQERDIAQGPGALADLKELGYMTTPVIVIDGAVIVGFDSAKIDKHTVDSNTLGAHS
jgi:glutaredoxin 3